MTNLCCSCPKCNPENPQGPHRPQRWKATKTTQGLYSGSYSESITINHIKLVEHYKALGYTITPLERNLYE